MAVSSNSAINIMVRVTAQKAYAALAKLQVQLDKVEISAKEAGFTLDALAGAARGYTNALGGASAEAANLSKNLALINRTGKPVARTLTEIGAGAELAAPALGAMVIEAKALSTVMGPLAAQLTLAASGLKTIAAASQANAVQMARADAIREQSAARAAAVAQGAATKEELARGKAASAAQLAATRQEQADIKKAAAAETSAAQVVAAEARASAARERAAAAAAASATSQARSQVGAIRAATALEAANLAAGNSSRSFGDRLTDSSNRMRDWGSRAQWMGRQISTGFTVPFAIAAGAGIKWALDQEKAFTMLAKVYNGAEDELQKVKKGLDLLSPLYGKNREEIYATAEAYASLGMTGGNLAQSVKNVIEVAITGNLELEEATQGLIAVQAQWKLSTKGVTDAMIQMNAAANTGPLEMKGLLESMSRVGSGAHDAGMSIRETVALLEQLAPATGTATMAGNGLKSILSSIMSPTKGANEELAAFGISTEKWTEQGTRAIDRLKEMGEVYKRMTPEQKIAFDQAIVGKYQLQKFGETLAGVSTEGSHFANVMAALADETRGANGEMVAGEGAMKIWAKELDTVKKSNPQKIAQAWQMVKNSLTDAFVPLIPTFVAVAFTIAKVAKWFSELPAPIQKFVIYAGLILAVIGPIIMVLASFAVLLSYLGPVLLFCGGALKAFGSGLLWVLSSGALGSAPAIITRTTAAFATMGTALGGIWSKLWVTQGRVAAGGVAANSGIIQRGLSRIAYMYVGLTSGVSKVWGKMWVSTARASATGAVANTGIIQRMIASIVTLFTGTLMPALSAIGSAIAGAFVAVAAALGIPVWALALLIAAIIAAGIAIYHWRDEIGRALKTAGQWFVNAVKTIGGAIAQLPGLIVKVFVRILKAIIELGKRIRDALNRALNPFTKHSPSLVENVHAGTLAIMDDYGNASASVIADMAAAKAAVQDFGNTSAGLQGKAENIEFQEKRGKIAAVDPAAAASYDRLHGQQQVLRRDLDQIDAAIKHQESVVAAWQDRIDAADKQIKALNKTLEGLQKVVDSTADALAKSQQKLDDLANTPIEGMQAMSDAIFENEMAQKRLRLEIMKLEDAGEAVGDVTDKYQKLQGQIDDLSGRRNELRAAGAGSDILDTYDKMIADLQAQQGALATTGVSKIDEAQKQLERLQREGEKLDLENSLKFDPLTRQIDKMTNSMKEMPFDQIVSGIQRQKAEVASLTVAHDQAVAAYERQQAVIDQATEARDAMTDSMQVEQDKLDQMQKTQTQVQEQYDEVTKSMDVLVQSADTVTQEIEDQQQAFEDQQQALEDEQKAAEDATKALEDHAAETDKAAEAMDAAAESAGGFGDALAGLEDVPPPELPAMEDINIDEWTKQMEDELNKAFDDISLNPFKDFDFKKIWKDIVVGFGKAIGGEDVGKEFEKLFQEGSGGIDWWFVITGKRGGWSVVWDQIVTGLGRVFLGKSAADEIAKGMAEGSGGVDWGRVIFGDKLSTLPGKVIEQLKKIPTAIKNWFLGVPSEVQPSADGATDGIASSFSSIPGKVLRWFGDTAMGIINWFATLPVTLLDSAMTAIGFIAGWWASLPNKITAAVIDLGPALGRAFQAAVDWLLTDLPRIWSGVMLWFFNLPGNVVSWIGDLLSPLGAVFSGALTWVGDNLPIWVEKVKQWFNGWPSDVVNWIGNLPQHIGDVFVGAFNYLRENLPGWFQSCLQWFLDLPGNIIQAIGALGAKMFQVGFDAIEGLRRGVIETAGDIGSWIWEHTGQKIIDGFKSGFGISSPSTVMIDMGKNIVQGMIDGIGEMGNALVEYVKGFIKRNVIDKAKDALHIGSPSKVFAQIGMNVGQGLQVGLSASAPGVQAAAQALADQMGNVAMPSIAAPTAGAAPAGAAAATGEKGPLAGVPEETQKAAVEIETVVTGHNAITATQLLEQGQMWSTAYTQIRDQTVGLTIDRAFQVYNVDTIAKNALTQAQQVFNQGTIAAENFLRDTRVNIEAEFGNTTVQMTASLNNSRIQMQTDLGNNMINLNAGMRDGIVNITTNLRDQLNTLTINTRDQVSTNFNTMATNLGNTFNNGVKPVFDAFSPMLNTVVGWFGTAVTDIGSQWDFIRGKTADPARFVINEVYNAGIKGAWNKVNGWLGLPPLEDFVAPFATGGLIERDSLSNPRSPKNIRKGGRLTGSTTGDRTLFAGKGGEYVLTQQMAKDAGLNRLEAWRKAANRGKSVEGAASTFKHLVPAFQGGGPVRPGVIDEVFKQLQPYKGRAYDYGGGGGSGGYDCSGWTGAVHKILLGQSPVGRIWTTEVDFGSFGYKRGKEGWWSMGVHNGGGGMNSHTAGTLDGINFESGGAHSTSTWGGPAAGTIHPQFENQYYLPELGGVFKGTAGGGGSGPSMSQMVEEEYEKVMKPVRERTPRNGPGTTGQYPWAGLGKFDIETKKFLLSKAAEKDAASAAAGNTAYNVGAGVEQWRGVVKEVLTAQGRDLSLDNITLAQMQTESGGNPNALNDWDSNWAAGHPSKGLMQVTDPTFQDFHDSHYPMDIWNPHANIAAALNQVHSRYGGPQGVWAQGHGYDNGGVLPPGVTQAVNNTGRPEAILSPAQWDSIGQIAHGIGSFVKNITKGLAAAFKRIFSRPIPIKPVDPLPIEPPPGGGGPGGGGPGGTVPRGVDPFWSSAAAQMASWTADLVVPIEGLEGVVANLPRVMNEVVIPEWPQTFPEIPEVVIPEVVVPEPEIGIQVPSIDPGDITVPPDAINVTPPPTTGGGGAGGGGAGGGGAGGGSVNLGNGITVTTDSAEVKRLLEELVVQGDILNRALQEQWNILWPQLQQAAVNLAPAFQAAAQNFLADPVGAIRGLADAVLQQGQALAPAFQSAVQALAPQFQAAAQALAPPIQAAVQALAPQFQGAVQNLAAQFGVAVQVNGQQISAQFQNTAQQQSAQFSADLQAQGAQFTAAIQGQGGQFTTAVQGQGAQFNAALQAQGQTLSAQFEGSLQALGAQFGLKIDGQNVQFTADIQALGAQFGLKIDGQNAQFTADLQALGAHFTADIQANGQEVATQFQGTVQDIIARLQADTKEIVAQNQPAIDELVKAARSGSFSATATVPTTAVGDIQVTVAATDQGITANAKSAHGNVTGEAKFATGTAGSGGSVSLTINGDLSFPNVTSPADVDDFLAQLRARAGSGG